MRKLLLAIPICALMLPMAGANGQSLNPGEVMVRGSAPVTFRVAVKVSNLMPDVAHVRVHCVLHQGTVPIAHGYTTTQISSSGNFDSTVTVPMPTIALCSCSTTSIRRRYGRPTNPMRLFGRNRSRARYLTRVSAGSFRPSSECGG